MPKAASEKVAKSKPEAKPRAKKDPNAPKRALSAYMFFVQDYRERIREENPGCTFGETGKLLGAKWKELSASEKKPYEKQAEDDKVRAASDKSAYDAGGGSGKAKPAKKASKKAASEEEDDEDAED